MSIEIKITVPNEEAHDELALARRLAVLGYARTATALYRAVSDPPPVASVFKPESELPQAAQDAKVYTVAADAKVYTVAANVEPAKKTRAKKAEAPNISAQPEHRVDPNVQAQDEADEAAEVATSEAVTAEDLRSVMGAYAAKFGMPATLEDGTAIFAGALGPAPESGWKLSVVAGIGGETLAKAVDAWSAAAAGSARYGEGA